MLTERLSPDDLPRAAQLLRAGELVAFPTETVYGLGADAFNPQAVERIFAAKRRPHWDPLIVHVASMEMLAGVAEASPQALKLMQAFWPGPLTLLLPRTPRVPDAVTAGRPLVGVRMPAHPLALELIRQAGVPIAAPSANLFGHTSPTTAAHVLADLDGRIAAVLDGGPTTVGLESTVAEPRADGAIVYRPGAVTLAMLEAVAGAATIFVPVSGQLRQTLPSPGLGLRHYAPRAVLQLVEVPAFRFAGLESTLLEPIAQALAAGETLGVMLPDGWATDSVPLLYPWGAWNDPVRLAQRLFAGLRALDDAGANRILCPVPPGDGVAAAVRDRLTRAATFA